MKPFVAILVAACVAAQTVINIFSDSSCTTAAFPSSTMTIPATTASSPSQGCDNAFGNSYQTLRGTNSDSFYYTYNDLAGPGSHVYGVRVYSTSNSPCTGTPVLQLGTPASVPTACTTGSAACTAAGVSNSLCAGSYQCVSGCIALTPTQTVAPTPSSTPAPIVPAVPAALAITVKMQLCDGYYGCSSGPCVTWTALMGTCVAVAGTGSSSGSPTRNGGSAIITTTNVYWYSDSRCTMFSFYFPYALATNPSPSSSCTTGYVSGSIYYSFNYKALAQYQAVTSGSSTSSSPGSNTLAVALFDPACALPLTTLQFTSSTPGCVASTTYSSTSSFSWGCDGAGNTLINVYLWSATCSELQPDLSTGFMPAGSDKCYALGGWYFGSMGMKLLSSPCSSLALPATPGVASAASSGSAASAAGVSGATVAVSVFVCLAIVGGAAAFLALGGAARVASTLKRRRSNVLSSKASVGANLAAVAVVSAPNPLAASYPPPLGVAPPQAVAAPAPAATDVPPLPPGWSEAWSRTKNAVYWKHISGTASWTRPVMDSDVNA